MCWVNWTILEHERENENETQLKSGTTRPKKTEQNATGQERRDHNKWSTFDWNEHEMKQPRISSCSLARLRGGGSSRFGHIDEKFKNRPRANCSVCCAFFPSFSDIFFCSDSPQRSRYQKTSHYNFHLLLTPHTLRSVHSSSSSLSIKKSKHEIMYLFREKFDEYEIVCGGRRVNSTDWIELILIGRSELAWATQTQLHL